MAKSKYEEVDYSQPNVKVVLAHKKLIVDALIEQNTEIVMLIDEFDTAINNIVGSLISTGIEVSVTQTAIKEIEQHFKRVTTFDKLFNLLVKLKGTAIVISRGMNVDIQKIKKAVTRMYKLDSKFTGHADIQQKIENLQVAVDYLIRNNALNSDKPYADILSNIRKRDHSDMEDLSNYLDTIFQQVETVRKENIRKSQKSVSKEK